MTLRTLARGTLLYGLGQFLPRAGTFILLPTYARFLTKADLGAFSLMVSLAGLLAIAFRLGLDSALLRFHFDYPAGRMGRLYASLAVASAIAVVVFSIPLAGVLLPFFPQLFAGLSFLPFGLLALAIGGANAFQFVPTAWLRATERPGRFLLLAATSFAAITLVTVLALIVLDWGAVGGLLGQLAGGLVMVAAAVAVIVRLPGSGIDTATVRSALAFGLPILPHAVAAWALNVSDRFLIGALSTGTPVEARAAVGEYWLGYQVGYVVALAALSLQAAWLPLIYRQPDVQAAARLTGRMLTVSAAFFVTIVVWIGATAPEIMTLLGGGAYAEAGAVAIVVAGGSAAYGIYTTLVGVILYARRTRALAFLTLTAAAINVTANLILIPRLGIMGAAWSTLLGFSAYAAMTYAFAGRRWPIQIAPVKVGAVIAIGLLALAVDLPMASSGGSIGIRLALAAAASAVLAWIALPEARRITTPRAA